MGKPASATRHRVRAERLSRRLVSEPAQPNRDCDLLGEIRFDFRQTVFVGRNFR
jgi:hypothetical protein